MREEDFPGPIKITKATAEKWEEKYQKDTTIEDSNKKVKAFLIPRESLEMVLKLNTVAVRAHIGINDQNERTLIFVGARYDKETDTYVDVYGPPVQPKNAEDSGPGEDEDAYDGARPCPPY
ncbi:hypothetical protein ACHRVK_06500 [Flavobacterium plurextorum]|uniref:hypothetical protein n=1 Tax=Flavobacterium TaxID=237 RepID=UPI00214DEFF9|nr:MULTISPECIES: hypothetical protein [Flavobacterium]UUW09250.1 hypothetical protein NLG42_00200 [Flavobacterium plurextorum]